MDDEREGDSSKARTCTVSTLSQHIFSLYFLERKRREKKGFFIREIVKLPLWLYLLLNSVNALINDFFQFPFLTK